LGSKPLELWSQSITDDGQLHQVTDEDIQSLVYEITAQNISKNYIMCPADPTKTLGIKLGTLSSISYFIK